MRLGQAAGQRQGLLIGRQGRVKLALGEQRQAIKSEQVGFEGRHFCRRGAGWERDTLERGQAGAKKLLSILLAVAKIEILDHGDQGVEQGRVIQLLENMAPGSADVIQLDLDLLEGLELAGAAQFEPDALQPGGVVAAVTCAHQGGLIWAVIPLLGSVLLDNLVHAETGLLGLAADPAEERFIDQGGEAQEHLGAAVLAAADDCGGGLAAEGVEEDRQAGEGLLVMGGEQVPGAFENGTQALVALGDVAQVGGEDVQAALELGGDFLAGKQLNPGSSQLDRQGHAFDQAADAGDGGAIDRRGAEASLDPAGVLEEELVGGKGLQSGQAGIGRNGHPTDRQDPFFGQAQALARGDQQAQAGAGEQDFGDQAGAGDQVLKVIQDEQELARPQEFDQLDLEGFGGITAHLLAAELEL